MSAFMCSDKHLIALATFYARTSSESSTPFSELVYGAYLTLHAENVKSLTHLYPADPGENVPASACEVERAAVRLPYLDPVKVLKAVQCYKYQACEHPDWNESRAFWLTLSITELAIQALPGYDDAKWGSPV